MSSETNTEKPKPWLMTVAELAGYLSVPIGWVYQHARPGHPDQLPCLRIGKYRRFRISEIERWLEKRGVSVPRHARRRRALVKKGEGS